VRVSSLLPAGLIIGTGCLLAALVGNDWNLLVLTFGGIVGLGVGLAYVTPIANLLKWFADKRGMIVGFAVMGSGFSALFWAPLLERLIGKNPAQYADSIPRTFITMAVIFTIAVCGLAQFYRVPPPGRKPASWSPQPGVLVTRNLTTGQMLRSWQFYALYAIFCLGTSVGQTAIGQAGPLLQEVGTLRAPISVGVALGILGLFNAAGRLEWGSVSDFIARKWVIILMSLVSVIACLGLLRAPGGFVSALAGLCVAAFAGFLALMPAFTADYFGPAHVRAN
jgi:OFA family oxalate/formate antiporter-like MFS transporter